MLKKIFRLPIQEWVKDKKTKTIAAKGDFFIARSRINGKKFGRFGVTVSAKVFKKAINRNRLKRKIFETIRVAGLTEKFVGRDILLNVLPTATQTKEKEIIDSLLPILNKLK